MIYIITAGAEMRSGETAPAQFSRQQHCTDTGKVLLPALLYWKKIGLKSLVCILALVKDYRQTPIL